MLFLSQSTSPSSSRWAWNNNQLRQLKPLSNLFLMTKPGNTAGLYYTAVASQEHWEKWKFLSRPASSAFLQHTISHGCIPLHTDIWNRGAGELSLTASTSAPGKADGSAEVCLPQIFEWTGNCKFSLKGAFFSFECFSEFTSHHSPCNSKKQQPVHDTQAFLAVFISKIP